MNMETRDQLKEILDCISDGVFITDGDGNIILLNKASEALCNYSADKLIGENMKDLIRRGLFEEEEVLCLKCIKNKEEISVMQKGVNEHHDLLVTGIPLLEDDIVKNVVITERDVSYIRKLEEEVKNKEKLAEKYKKELEYYRDQNIEEAENIAYASEEMRAVIMLALKVAKQDVTVLLQGESGTGKEVIAKLIHKSSARWDKPFIKINCGAIPENLLESELFGYEKGAFTGANDKGKPGLFEVANEGTLFLDEIGSLPLHMQVKLLRVLQERELMRIGGKENIPVDVRIIAATNINLKTAVEKKEFRKDLYYRLNVVPLMIQPLRHRKADIYPLAKRFLSAFNKKYLTKKTIDENGMRAMMKYHWPGNVRELENLVERLVVTTENDTITGAQVVQQLSEYDFATESDFEAETIYLKQKVEEYEKRCITFYMQYYSSSQELADALGIDKSTLTRKMKRYHIKNIYVEL